MELTPEQYSEKQIVWNFADNQLRSLEKLLKVEEIRVYAFEFPIEYDSEKGRIDLVLEVVKNGNIFNRENTLLVLEFKKNKIKYGPIDQLKFYMKDIGPRLYRPNVLGFLVAPEFSQHEIEECKEAGYYCIQFDYKNNIRLINWEIK